MTYIWEGNSQVVMVELCGGTRVQTECLEFFCGDSEVFAVLHVSWLYQNVKKALPMAPPTHGIEDAQPYSRIL